MSLQVTHGVCSSILVRGGAGHDAVSYFNWVKTFYNEHAKLFCEAVFKFTRVK